MPGMNFEFIDEYLNFLVVEKGASHNTLEAYSRDLNRYTGLIQERGIKEIHEISPDDVIYYLSELKRRGFRKKFTPTPSGIPSLPISLKGVRI